MENWINAGATRAIPFRRTKRRDAFSLHSASRRQLPRSRDRATLRLVSLARETAVERFAEGNRETSSRANARSRCKRLSEKSRRFTRALEGLEKRLKSRETRDRGRRKMPLRPMQFQPARYYRDQQPLK